MMARFQRIALVLGSIGLIAFSASSAQAKVSVVGGAVYSLATGTPTPTGGFGFPGGGLLFGIKLGSKVDLDIGALYLTRTYNQGGTINSGLVEGQLGFGINFTRGFGLGIGGYADYVLTPAVDQGYGAYASLRFRIPLGASAAILIEPQYHYAFTKVDNGAKSITPSEIVGLLGVTFGMGGK